MSSTDYPEDSQAEDEYQDEMYRGDEQAADAPVDDESWWEEGLATTLLVAGVVLFVFPEPITSTVGVALVVAGVGIWAYETVF